MAKSVIKCNGANEFSYRQSCLITGGEITFQLRLFNSLRGHLDMLNSFFVSLTDDRFPVIQPSILFPPSLIVLLYMFVSVVNLSRVVTDQIASSNPQDAK